MGTCVHPPRIYRTFVDTPAWKIQMISPPVGHGLRERNFIRSGSYRHLVSSVPPVGPLSVKISL